MAAPMPLQTEEPISGMSRLVTVEIPDSAPRAGAEVVANRGRQLCAELEAGNILFFARPPFEISAVDRDFLLGRTQTSSALHKNIAYRPAEDRITGLAKSEEHEGARLSEILRSYSQSAVWFLSEVLAPYAGKWRLDFASFRPLEEKGRPARLHARNDLPHFDAFPTRPTNGDRILRFFTNLNPTQNRAWITSQTFETIGPQFAKKIGLPSRSIANPFASTARTIARVLRLPGARRSPYDTFMHRCHNAMKEDQGFRESCPTQRWEFPPNSSWMVFTDCVSHAVLEGQYALEQTFIISRAAMVEPQRSPIAILERLAGHSLSTPGIGQAQS
ncbi:MAG TPA: Kdo hydroxylase family protein [Candidatus Acidoferrum sp.]|nr:Kdo hydroxylase family protein [Candidatus Acidoferrum sp.]